MVDAAVEVMVDSGAPGRADALDRGLHYGDGLFETLAVHDGTVRHLARHLARLSRDATRLCLPAPDVATLTREIQAAAHGRTRAVLKLMYTAGIGGRGYRRPPQVTARRILLRYPWPDAPPDAAHKGVRIRVCETRLAAQPRLAGIKHLSRLEYVLARSEWDDPAVPEGLLLDTRDRLVEGIRTNVFLVQRGRLATPALDQCGVAGVARAFILEQAAARGITCTVGCLTRADLAQAEEVFVCNSVMGIWPVRACEAQRYTPGPRTRLLQAAWEQGA